MRKHAGTWALRLSAEDIIINGKALKEPFDQLSRQDFEAYARREYDIDYRRALDWLNIERRFANRLDLINGLTEATIRRLAAPFLTMTDVERIIAQIRAGTIKSDYRSVEQAIRSFKAIKPTQEGSTVQVSSSMSLLESPQFSQRTLENRTLEDLEARKRNIEVGKVEMEKDLVALRTEKDNLLMQIAAFHTKISDLEVKEKQLQTKIDKFHVEMQAVITLLELYEHSFETP